MDPELPIHLAGLAGLGPWELGIVLLIVLVVFGAGKLPTAGRSLGEAIRNFRKASRGADPKKSNKTDATS